ncbi:MAG TPA: glycosyltransferase family 39 protein, partial [Acidimicrobiales bacterium]|nr:glycosyltransferase family 39 protein [Acidimicrobiales bacterium]
MTVTLESRPSLSRSPTHVTKFHRWLVPIVTGAFLLRLLVLVLSHGERVSGDGYEWSKQANLNAAGHWFVSPFSLRPDALRPPGWALVLTVWAWLGQHSWFRQQLLASLVGTATVLVIALAARRIGGERAAIITAIVAAIYPGFWVYERALLSETLLLLGVSAMTLVTYRFWARPSTVGAAVLGVGTGLLALTRSEQILVAPLLVLPLIVGRRQIELRTRGIWLALAAVCVIVVILPWTIFNLGRFQKPVFLSNGFGAAAATGN